MYKCTTDVQIFVRISYIRILSICTCYRINVQMYTCTNKIQILYVYRTTFVPYALQLNYIILTRTICTILYLVCMGQCTQEGTIVQMYKWCTNICTYIVRTYIVHMYKCKNVQMMYKWCTYIVPNKLQVNYIISMVQFVLFLYVVCVQLKYKQVIVPHLYVHTLWNKVDNSICTFYVRHLYNTKVICTWFVL